MKCCSVCKEHKTLTEFGRRTDAKDGLYCQCKKCKSKKAKHYRDTHKEELREKKRLYQIKAKKRITAYMKEYKHKFRKTVNFRYQLLKDAARKGKYQLEIDLEKYKQLVSLNSCYYCKDTLPRAGHGLDRIDSSLGYVISNVRPCCIQCNRMKSNFSEEQFLNKIKKIVERLGL